MISMKTKIPIHTNRDVTIFHFSLVQHVGNKGLFRTQSNI